MQIARLPLLATLVLLLLGPCNAAPTVVNNRTPPPTYPFTLAAFISPYPLFSNTTYSPGVNGVAVHALNGSFYVNPATPSPSPATVFFVDAFGQAFLKEEILLKFISILAPESWDIQWVTLMLHLEHRW